MSKFTQFIPQNPFTKLLLALLIAAAPQTNLAVRHVHVYRSDDSGLTRLFGNLLESACSEPRDNGDALLRVAGGAALIPISLMCIYGWLKTPSVTSTTTVHNHHWFWGSSTDTYTTTTDYAAPLGVLGLAGTALGGVLLVNGGQHLVSNTPPEVGVAVAAGALTLLAYKCWQKYTANDNVAVPVPVGDAYN